MKTLVSRELNLFIENAIHACAVNPITFSHSGGAHSDLNLQEMG